MDGSIFRRAVIALALKIAPRLGYDLVRKTLYSPVPEVPDKSSARWEEKTALAGLEFDTGPQLSRLREEIAPYFGEFFPPEERSKELWRLYSANGYYRSGDAEVLYGMIRHLKPRSILELGSGFSTIITAMACAVNEGEGFPVEFVSSDPEPRVALPGELAGLVTRNNRPAQEIALEQFLALEEGDVLFVDTTHTVKRGSDVNHLVLEVMPRLKAGVVVHFHDIFLPWDYPREWFLRGTFLAEQYLLQAYLAENDRYEILLAMYALSRKHPGELGSLLPEYRPYYHGPSAFWLRRRC